jgi:mono/diheme cytochrome c family protein
MTKWNTAYALAALLVSATAAFAEESNQVARGGTLYKEYCSLCHGADGQRGEGFQTPIWGAKAQIKKFEHALGLFEYMLFLMPFDNPNKINEQQKWDIIAYMMANHGAMERNKTIEPSTANSVPIK